MAPESKRKQSEVSLIGEGKRLRGKTEYPKPKPCHVDVENSGIFTVWILKH